MGSINQLRITPVFCAAIGAAAGFYIPGGNYSAAGGGASFFAAAAVISLLIAAMCFFRTLSSFDNILRLLRVSDAQSRILRLTSVCCAALAAGAVFGLCASYAGRNEINTGIAHNKVTAVEGVLLEDPRILTNGTAMVSVSLTKCAGDNGLRVNASGVVTVFFSQVNAQKTREFGRGTTVFAEGSLRQSNFGISFSAGSLHIVKPASAFERMRTGIRLGLIDLFEGKTWGGLALAMLLGVRDNLDSDFTARYGHAGLSYILALSGMHLAVLAALITFLLRKPLGLKMSAALSAVIIIMYCVLVGPMPSLNRAALMYVLGAAAVIGFLPKSSISVLSLSFLIQLFLTPEAGSSLSFILSYVALLGIIITGDSLFSLFAGKVPDFLLQPLSLSCGVFLATAGICGFTFGRLAPVGIAAGLVIVPLTTVFICGSLVWIVLNFPPFSAMFDFPMTLLYRIMDFIASVAGNAPAISANPYIILAVSLVLSLIVIVIDKTRRKIILEPEPFL